MKWRPLREGGPSVVAPEIAEAGVAQLLANHSLEVTARDVEAVAGVAVAGTEVFVANLPKDGNHLLVAAARRLREAGLVPVPHIVARKIADRRELDDLVARLSGEAGVERVLALGGDRDDAVGEFDESLELIGSGVFEARGIRHLSVACYPEGHPRISDDALRAALEAKLASIAAIGAQARLVSQFAFSPEPIVNFARGLRDAGVAVPLRVGLAGPAPRATLVRYAIRCGVGASLRMLTERRGLVGGLLGAETPGEIVGRLADACRSQPALGIEGVHFFTFGAPARSIEWARDHLQ